MDEEVQRLRRMREAATRVRGLAFAFSRTGLLQERSLKRITFAISRRVAHAASDRLNEYPHRSFLARRCKSPLQLKRTMLGALLTVQRLVDDTRSLTRSTDLSAALGPVQADIRWLLATWQRHARGAARALEPVRRPIGVGTGVDAGVAATPLREQPFLGLLVGGEPRARSRGEGLRESWGAISQTRTTSGVESGAPGPGQ